MPYGTAWGQTPGADFEMMTFSTVLARCGVGRGASRCMPKVSLMSGFEKPPPPVPAAEKGAVGGYVQSVPMGAA